MALLAPRRTDPALGVVLQRVGARQLPALVVVPAGALAVLLATAPLLVAVGLASLVVPSALSPVLVPSLVVSSHW